MSISNNDLPADLPDSLVIELTGAQSATGWRRASATGDNGGNCAEVKALSAGYVALRNSRQPSDHLLVFTPGEWKAFMDGAAKGEFDF